MNCKKFVADSMAIIILFTGCTARPDPQRVLTKCLNAVFNYDHEKVYELFTCTDKSVKSLSEFMADNAYTADDTAIVKIVKNNMSYNIRALQIHDDSAYADLEMIVPDVMANRLSYLFSNIARIHVVDSLTTFLGKDVYLIKVQGTIVMLKESSGWRIFGNWEGKRKQEASESAERFEYIKNKIYVKNIKVHRYHDQGDAYLSALLKNAGARALRDVELLIVCLDANNKPCYTKNVYPVSGLHEPLPPMTDKKFKVVLDNVPVNWANRVEIKVINCKFF